MNNGEEVNSSKGGVCKQLGAWNTETILKRFADCVVSNECVCLSKCLFCSGTTAAQYINGTGCFSERDAFDTLFDHAPDKLNVVKKVGKFLFLKNS